MIEKVLSLGGQTSSGATCWRSKRYREDDGQAMSGRRDMFGRA